MSSIKWAALGQVFGIGLGVGLGTVVLFSLAIVGLSRARVARAGGGDGIAGGALASVCLAACVVIAGGGIYLIANH